MLEWVLVDGVERHVSEFAHLAPKARPGAACPVCDTRLTLKLGSQVAYHAAHRPEASCAAVLAETAAHLNSKFHIAHQLERGVFLDPQAHLQIMQDCFGGCGVRLQDTWLKSWDGVVVEKRLDASDSNAFRRPDITIFRGSTAVGAVEIHVTNSVDGTRASDLARLTRRWLEVAGHESLYQGTPWHIEQPLLVERVSGEPWLCDRCAEAEKRRRAHRAKHRAERKHRERNGVQTRWFKVVDFYYPSGKKFRELFTIEEYLDEGRTMSVTLERNNNKPELVSKERPPIDRSSYERLRRALRRCCTRRNAIVDSPMPWRRPADPVDIPFLQIPNFVYGNITFPRRFEWIGNRWVQVMESPWKEQDEQW